MSHLARITGLVLVAAVSGSSAGVDYAPMIEISGGYEYTNVPGNTPDQPSDETRSGARIIVNVEALRLNFKEEDASEGAILSFLPLVVEFEPSIENLHNDGFGGSGSAIDLDHPVRRVVGALVDARYDFLDGRLLVRGKLASAEYDRDRGFVDWRVLDAETGVHHVWEPGAGDVIVDLEIRAGLAAGGLHLNGIRELQDALRISADTADAMILTPHATASAGLDFDELKIQWSGTVEQRFDLTSEDTGPTMNSTRFMTALEASYRVTPGEFSNEFQVFAGARYELDTLTAGNMFFDSNNLFHSVLVQIGIRGSF